MRGDEILLWGLGVLPPWLSVNQHLDTATQPHELYLQVEGERGARYPCPQCGALCPADDFTEKRWRHLNFFQHECYITASVARVKCPKHGMHLLEVPWARKGSAFTLLFEQAALALVRERPVLAAARLMVITGTRLWRIVRYYVDQAVGRFDVRAVSAIGLDKTSCKRGHHYVTVFIDMARRKEPVLFVTPGRGKDTLRPFAAFLRAHGGEPGQVLEVVCDRSPAFLRGVEQHLPGASITGDWFHIVQLLNRSVDVVRKALATLKTQARRVVQRCTSKCTNARLEVFNGHLQAARARAREYRNTGFSAPMISDRERRGLYAQIHLKR